MLLDLGGEGPVYERIHRALRREVLEGRIAPGARLPATRTLARSLGVSRNVVLLAYERLLEEGYVTSRVGSGTYVRSAMTGSRKTPAAEACLAAPKRSRS